ncbi:hypothetical protein GC089_07535 [Cellulomonas sp. JZ18]|uniref:hypothetical protein n=1 Tax=Cellulomonas sp. JZ18 TaxID=2654191 RepID=UPI0012D4C2AD|nr:hypothetical protein [Cellulomonas sp. JZ18]QGQ19105.1 hypothetical protein GC089_07535 [Cellulomonas sp. JZ18]
MTLRPRWRWRLRTEAGAEVDRPTSPVFLARFEAEQWLGEHWRGLAAQGVRSVVLEHDGDEAGAPLRLPPV